MKVIFDLDNTIYPPESGLLKNVDLKINTFMQEILGIPSYIVDNLRQEYRKIYGITLKGLMIHHNVDPYQYLDFVHNLDYHLLLNPDPLLYEILSSIDAEKYIFTNGSKKHAINVLTALGILDLFHDIYSIEDLSFKPKPSFESFEEFIKLTEINPYESYFIDDMPENIEAAKRIGFKTVLVGNEHCENADITIKSIYEVKI
ncbi:MAG: pyrimidine 5'-nucleotidase [Calditerrivibrio sp.]|nr:pyrimidine 5'-nucleotidase [Calditerrivibrio sp.]